MIHGLDEVNPPLVTLAATSRLDRAVSSSLWAEHACSRMLRQLGHNLVSLYRPALPLIPNPRPEPSLTSDRAVTDDPNTALWTTLQGASERGLSIGELMTTTGMGRTWIYDRLQELAASGRASRARRGRWIATTPDDPTEQPATDPD